MTLAANYTQDEFLKAVEASGTAGQWSDSDWRNALEDPDWGMSMLSGKIRYNKAQTDEERAAAHQWNEDNRRMKGYSGGGDGSYYHIVSTPASFTFEDAPSFESSATTEKADIWDKMKEYPDYVAPEYISRHQDNLDRLEQQVANMQPFSYDASTDPLYSQYRKQYIREGRRAAEDTMGIAAAMTGGLPSSYAATAAAQQGNYYASQLTDKIPELYQLAYNQYVSDNQIARSNLSAIQALEQADRSQFNIDRDFDYGVYGDKYNRLANNLQLAQGMEADDWSRYLDQYNIYDTNRNFAYNQFSDELASQRQEQQDKWDQAAIAASYGDYSFLQSLGIDTSNNPQEIQQKMQEIQQAYAVWQNTGDASMLAALGIEPSLTNINRISQALTGEYSETSDLTEEQVMQLQYALGVTMDGWWGPESMSAAGGMTAAEAWQAMQNGTLQKTSGGGGYYGGGDDGGGDENYIPAPGFNPYDNAGTVAGPGDLVGSIPYITGKNRGLSTTTTYGSDAADYGTTVNGEKMPSRTASDSLQAEKPKDRNANAASTADMTALTMALTAEAANGASASELTGIINDAYNEGAISEAQRDQMTAKVDSQYGKSRRK